MARILYEATDATGQLRSGAIEADSPEAAERALLAQGLSAIKVLPESAPQSAPQFDSEAWAGFEASLRRTPSSQTYFLELLRIRRVLLAIDLLFVLAAGYFYSGRLALIGLALIAYHLGLPMWRYKHSQHYAKMLRAYFSGQWRLAQQLLKKFGALGADNVSLKFDCAIREAVIRIKLGVTDLAQEAVTLGVLRKDVVKHAPALFDIQLAVVAQAAGDGAQAIAAMRRALAILPDDVARMVDVALLEARFGSTEASEVLLRALADKAKPESAAPFIAWAQGLNALRTGSDTALPRLAEAVTAFMPMAANPSAHGALGLCCAAYALALGRAGLAAPAERVIRLVAPVVTAHGDAVLLDMLRAELPDAMANMGSVA